MDLKQCKAAFKKLLGQIEDAKTTAEFLDWIKEDEGFDEEDAEYEIGDAELGAIAAELRACLPPSGVLPDERVLPSVDSDNATTIYLDAFLYDDDAIDEHFQQGTLERYYCTRCQSRCVRPLTYKTHSMSKERISWVFQSLLPRLDGKTVVDVGSRLGAVLYGAYFYSAASRIVGIEMNAHLHHLQSSIVQKHKLGERIALMHGNLLDFPEALGDADVVILHNVFASFVPADEERACWEFLHSKVRKKGSLIVSIPDLRLAMERVGIEDVDKVLASWVRKLDITDFVPGDHPELSDISMYVVGG